MATVADMIAAVAARTGTPAGRVKHVTRRLQESNLLPLASGGAVPSIRIENLASVVLAVLADAQLKDIAKSVEVYGALVPAGVDVKVMPASILPAPTTARGWLTNILRTFATGTAEERAAAARLHIEAVSNWPEIAIHAPTIVTRFVEPGALANGWQRPIRRSITLTGRVLELIVSDLKLKR